MKTPLNTIYSVTYHLELHVLIPIYCILCILPTNVEFGFFLHYKMLTTLLSVKFHQ